MKKRTRYILIIAIVLFLIGLGFVVAHTVTKDSLISLIGYKNISEYEVKRTVGIGVFKQSDGKFYHSGGYGERKRQRITPWFGNEYDRVIFSDGILIIDPQKQFSGYDTNIVAFLGKETIPRSIGKTRLLFSWKSQVDTFYLIVNKIDGTFSVDVQR
jgi:hypothetical protein